MKKRVLSMLMTLALCLSLLPTAALAADPEAAPAEQFSGLTLGETYWFDLSGAGIPGTVNEGNSEGAAAVPDKTLRWVPFTYAGTVKAYVLNENSSGVKTASEAAASTTSPDGQYGYTYDHSLFIADYAVTHTVSWDELNEKGLIFGTAYTSGGVDYTLRAPSVGDYTGLDDSERGVPQSNEWDTMLNKNSGYIQNWNGMLSWGQDTFLEGDSYRAFRGDSLARGWGCITATYQDANRGFRPVLEILNPDTLKSDGLKVVTLDLGGGKLGNSSKNIQIIVKNGGTFAAPASDGLNRPDGDTGSFFMWLGSNGKLYAPGDSVPADVTKLTAQFALSEQFSLKPGGRYYFDLSGASIPGTVNTGNILGATSLPDTTLHYVPFTYAGTIEAYKLTSEMATTEEYAEQNKYPHSLFVADYVVTNDVSWNTLNEKNLIFGKSYTSGGVDYNLRAPSAGSNSTGSGDSQRGVPQSNEWDTMLNKDSGYIQNWNEINSWGQDASSGSAPYRAVRGYRSARDWDSSYVTNSYPGVGFRPVLEILNPGDLGANGLTTVTLDLNGGHVGRDATAVTVNLAVKSSGTYTAPSSDGLTRPDGDTGSYFVWLGSNGKLYAPGASVPADVTKLTAQFTLSEQFSLTPGGRYYFDLSGEKIPGTANGNLPDSALHYVPFTYAGTIEAYKLMSAMATTEEYAQKKKYAHSLFVADYAVTHTVSWDDLNSAGLIFGKGYVAGGVDYTLRAPSAGSNSTGSGDSGPGVPQSNEWDTMLNKDDEYIQNWNEMFSWGQDTFSGDASYRARRGYRSARYWVYLTATDQYVDVGFRPVLEVLNPDTLGSDGLTTVTLDLNGGHVGRDATAVTVNLAVKSSGTYTAPSSDGLTRPTGNDGAYFKWQDSSGNFYEPGGTVPADVTSLTALWEKQVPTLTAPTANTLVYNGSAQALVTAGTTADGTMQYSLDNTDWSTGIPTGTDAKTYTVYYKVVGDSNYTDSEPASVSVTIAPRSIADASVTLGESLTYNGSSQTQTVTVKLGEVDITSSCNVSNNVQTNADSYTLTVTAKDNSNYTGSVTKDFTIAKKSITPTIAVSGTYTFTGSAITPAFTVKDGDTALTDSDYTAVLADNINAGSGKITVTEKTTGNYTFSEAQQSFTIGKAAAPTLDNISVSQKYTVTTQQSKDIGRAGMSANAGTLAYAKGTEEEITYVSSWNVEPDTGKVTFTLSGGAAGSTVTLPIKITSTNYADSTVNVVITLTDKDVPTVNANDITVTYTGSAVPNSAITGTASVAGSWSFKNAAPVKVADSSDSVTVVFTPADTDTYETVEDFIKVTINKATPTGTPAYTAITTGGKTLADAALAIGTITPTGGSIAWDVAADTAVTANTAYNWTYTPTDPDNYNNLTGSITPYVVSYSGGGSSGSSNTTTKTEKNPDGSTTTTVTDKKTGTVTETTKNTDGSTTVVETKKDGTVTETNKSADGSTGTVKTDKNGSVTEVKSTVSTAAAKEAAKTGEAVTLPVEVPAAKTTEDAPAVEISVPKSTGSVKVEIPVGKVTPGTVAVIVHADGTEEIVKTSIPTKTGVALKLEGSATVKVIDNAKKFSDVPASHWASEAVAFASARGITGGTSDTTFSPDTPCTRGQIVTFLWRAAGSPEPKGLSNLSDVPADAYYAKAVAWALENGITGGTGNGMFSPDATCTRSQSVTFLYRAAGSPTASDDIAFGDVTAESYYADAVAWAAQNGITSGIGSGLFGPANECSRAQIVTFLYRSAK
ncbi:S-layer homology domain-containing protein [Candidatus Agathobaculum pullicola]|uniref:S-layer homology domain-containing protein n=1 Tax=Candidatus Agathobaculum pullicola TaxID=2838426 RepID=UPI003F903F4B